MTEVEDHNEAIEIPKKEEQLYGWFSQKQLEAIAITGRVDTINKGILIPMYYIENGNTIICTMISRDPEEHGSVFKDIQLLGKVYQYAGAYKGEFGDIEFLNKEALNI